MILKTIRCFVTCILILLCSRVSSQNEYRAEIGISGGGSHYIGDANSQLFKNVQPAFGGFFRYKLNPRVSIKMELISTGIVGTFKTSTASYLLNKQINAGELVGEVNFFDFEKIRYNRLSKNFTPYVFGGIGGMTSLYSGQSFPELCIPFGIGMKVKMGGRWKLNIMWSNKLLLADNLEEDTKPTIRTALNNEANLNGTNIFNNDLLSSLTVGVSLDIWKKQCDCINTRYKNTRK